ncbi:MAG: hypothetical protein R2845_02155 [Thermomicrobiales bacterium]
MRADRRDRELPAFGTITAIRQQQSHPDRVNVFLDGEYAFAVTREQALSAGLSIGRELSVDEVASLRAGDMVSKAIEAALRLLVVRPRSEHELRDRLKRKNYEPETIALALERVRGWEFLSRRCRLCAALGREPRSTSPARGATAEAGASCQRSRLRHYR